MKSIHTKLLLEIHNKLADRSWKDLTKGALILRLRNATWELEGLIKAMENDMLLFPDMSKEQHFADHFVYAAPCTSTEWHKVLGRCKTKEPDEQGFMPYTYLDEEGEKICIIPRPFGASDDDCLGTAAWIRMVDEFRGMIYALPYCNEEWPNTIASIIARTAGVEPSKVRHVTL